MDGKTSLTHTEEKSEFAETSKKLLITGGTGKLGSQLVRVFPNSIHPDHGQLDIANTSAVSEFVERTQPEVLIHCAAVTGIRACEEGRELAWSVNVQGTRNLVEACQRYASNCYFVHISTPCVFYGDKGGYSETDIPYPKNFYGVTKLASELAVLSSGLDRFLVVRTNFIPKEPWPYERAFVDRYGTYLFAVDVAKAIKFVIRQQLPGIIHICGNRKVSMFDLAKSTTPNIRPMTLSEYNGPPLTVDMSLISKRIEAFTMSQSLELAASR